MFKKILEKIHLARSEKSFALNQLDLKLDSYLNYRGGFFIEAGSNDGIRQSNTLFFERYRNWRGMLIEPIPDLAIQSKRNRPRCIVENFALVPFDFQDSQIEMKYCNLMSLVKGAMKSDEADKAHIELGCNVQKVETYTTTVPAATLTSILDKHDVQKIDFLSLDVEGYELNVLKGIDFAKHRPTWMLIEARFRDEIDSFLDSIYEPVAELTQRDILYRSRKD